MYSTLTEQNRPPVTLTRRAAITMLVLSLAGSTLQPKFKAPVLVKVPATPTPLAPRVSKPQPPLLSWPSLDTLVQGMIDRKMSPGMSLSVMHDGVFLYSKGFGFSNIEANVSTTPQTGFRIASISKQFTAASILLLAEAGQLSVDDRLARFLPQFPRAQDISLRQLLSHTSGLGDYLNGGSQAVLRAAEERDYDFSALLAAVSAPNPLFRFEPGTAWSYSNSGFVLLGLVVEKVSGLALGDFCQKYLFAPSGLGMTAIDRTCSIANNCHGYRPGHENALGFKRALPISPSFAGGAGAIRSTTQDLCRWHDALFHGQILKPASLNAMLTPVRLNNGNLAWEQGAHEALHYGFGQGLGQLNKRPFVAHGGRLNGFTGQLRSFPAEKLTVACLYNCDGTGVPGYLLAEKAVRTEAVRLGLEHLGLA